MSQFLPVLVTGAFGLIAVLVLYIKLLSVKFQRDEAELKLETIREDLKQAWSSLERMERVVAARDQELASLLEACRENESPDAIAARIRKLLGGSAAKASDQSGLPLD